MVYFKHTFLFLIFLLPKISSAQVLAGSVPPGTSIQYPNIHLADSTIDTPESDSIDVDCDGTEDLAFDLIMGNTSIDGPHTLWIRILNSSVEIWGDSLQHSNTVPFYYFGDTMCNDGFHWRSDSLTQIACGNAFCWFAISVATDTFIAFRSTVTQEIGWVKISFDIFLSNPITASVTEVLQFCLGSGIGEMKKPSFTLSPNPANDKITISFNMNMNSNAALHIYNSIGAQVKSMALSKLNDKEVTLDISDLSKGVYIVEVINEGSKNIKKLVVQ